jgi:hypothetical protein
MWAWPGGYPSREAAPTTDAQPPWLVGWGIMRGLSIAG